MTIKLSEFINKKKKINKIVYKYNDKTYLTKKKIMDDNNFTKYETDKLIKEGIIKKCQA